MDSDIPTDEIAKHSYLFQFSKLFVRLLKAITPNETFVYSDETRDLYLSLKKDVTFFANAIDQDCEQDSALGIRYFVEDELPEDLSAELAQPQLLNKFISDINQIERCVDDLEDSIAPSLVELSPFFLEGVANYQARIENTERENGVRLRLQHGEADDTIQEITLESIQNDVTFNYVKDNQTKSLLEDFLKEVFITFKSKAFRSCVVLQEAILEAILVDVLNQHYDDAMIGFVELYKHGRSFRMVNGRPPLLDWWEFMEMVDVAKRLDILTTSRIGDDCHEFKDYRNTIHIHNKRNQRLQVSYKTCQLGFYCLRAINHDLSRKLQGEHEN